MEGIYRSEEERTKGAELYEQAIKEAAEAFKDRLHGHAQIILSKKQYDRGTDALPEDLANIVTEIGHRVEDKLDYELSYNQINKAFFAAAKELGILSIQE